MKQETFGTYLHAESTKPRKQHLNTYIHGQQQKD